MKQLEQGLAHGTYQHIKAKQNGPHVTLKQHAPHAMTLVHKLRVVRNGKHEAAACVAAAHQFCVAPSCEEPVQTGQHRMGLVYEGSAGESLKDFQRLSLSNSAALSTLNPNLDANSSIEGKLVCLPVDVQSL